MSKDHLEFMVTPHSNATQLSSKLYNPRAVGAFGDLSNREEGS